MPEVKIPAGAALEYLRKKFAGVFTELESTPGLTTSVSSPVGNNPDRLGLVVINTGAANATLSLKQTVAAGTGVVLAANGGSMALSVDDDFTLVTREWAGLVAAGTTTLYVLEIVRPISDAQLAGGGS